MVVCRARDFVALADHRMAMRRRARLTMCMHMCTRMPSRICICINACIGVAGHNGFGSAPCDTAQCTGVASTGNASSCWVSHSRHADMRRYMCLHQLLSPLLLLTLVLTCSGPVHGPLAVAAGTKTQSIVVKRNPPKSDLEVGRLYIPWASAACNASSTPATSHKPRQCLWPLLATAPDPQRPLCLPEWVR